MCIATTAMRSWLDVKLHQLVLVTILSPRLVLPFVRDGFSVLQPERIPASKI